MMAEIIPVEKMPIVQVFVVVWDRLYGSWFFDRPESGSALNGTLDIVERGVGGCCVKENGEMIRL